MKQQKINLKRLTHLALLVSGGYCQKDHSNIFNGKNEWWYNFTTQWQS